MLKLLIAFKKKENKTEPFLIFCNDLKNLIILVGKSHLNFMFFVLFFRQQNEFVK